MSPWDVLGWILVAVVGVTALVFCTALIRSAWMGLRKSKQRQAAPPAKPFSRSAPLTPPAEWFDRDA